MKYKNPRLKHVKKIVKICEDMQRDFIFNTAVYTEKKTNLILNRCNLLLETKKAKKRKKYIRKSLEEEVKCNGKCSWLNGTVSDDCPIHGKPDTKKSKKWCKCPTFMETEGFCVRCSLPKKDYCTDPKEESKKYLWSVADEEKLDKKNAPKTTLKEIGLLSSVVKRNQSDREFVMCIAEKVEELVERINKLSKAL